jgi:tetratricopeptide (TPR) repeat protein
LLAQVLERLKPLKLPSIEGLEFDCRTRLFTSLVRFGRQAAASDPEKETKRKEMLGVLGGAWKAVGDERRAALCMAAGGHSEPAVKLLESSGQWEEAALLHRREGRLLEAARLYEQHQQYPAALAIFKEAGDGRGSLRTALLAGDREEAMKAARGLPLKASREIFFKHRQGDFYLDLLAERQEWNEIGSLYEQAEQWGDAAQALERGQRFSRAAELYKKAEDEAGAERCLSAEVDSRLARKDVAGAGELLCRFGRHERAAELVREPRPDLAFKWLQEGGLDARALELAKQQARGLEQAGKSDVAAAWLERAGELPAAAQAFMDAGRPLEALRLWEQLGDWERAGEAAAKAGRAERALQLLRRAGAADADERVKRLAPAPVEPPAE